VIELSGLRPQPSHPVATDTPETGARFDAFQPPRLSA
jgi:hypothetical protein